MIVLSGRDLNKEYISRDRKVRQSAKAEAAKAHSSR